MFSNISSTSGVNQSRSAVSVSRGMLSLRRSGSAEVCTILSSSVMIWWRLRQVERSEVEEREVRREEASEEVLEADLEALPLVMTSQTDRSV